MMTRGMVRSLRLLSSLIYWTRTGKYRKGRSKKISQQCQHHGRPQRQSKIYVAQKFSIKAKDPISDKVYIRIGLKLIEEAGILVDTCREWSLVPNTSRTKNHFHLVFAKAFRYHTETDTV